MINPSIENSDFLFWHENIWSFLGNFGQTDKVHFTSSNLVCVYTHTKFKKMKLKMLEQIYDPNIFLALRLLCLFPVFKVFPYAWMKIVLIPYTLAQFAIEWKMEEYPNIAALSPVLIAIFLFGIFPGYYYFLFQNSTNNFGIYLSIVLYIAVMATARILDFGFPKDDPQDRIKAIKDPVWQAKHLLFTCATLPIFYLPYMMFYDPAPARSYLLPAIFK